MKRRKVMQVAAVWAIVLVVALLWPGEKEPEYQGKKLSEWLKKADLISFVTDDEAGKGFGRAIRAAGTNAVPYLLRQIRQRNLGIKGNFAAALCQLPNSYRPVWAQDYVGELNTRQIIVEYSFQYLGSEATPAAIRELVNLVDRAPNSKASLRAMRVLTLMGRSARPAVPALAAHLKDADNQVRIAATNAIQSIVPEMFPEGYTMTISWTIY